jgi:hypothetical protein
MISNIVSTYKPAYPGQSAALTAKNVVLRSARYPGTICSCHQKNEVETEAKGRSPVFLKLIPVTRVDFLRYPQKEVQRVEVGRNAVGERLATDEPGHDENTVVRARLGLSFSNFATFNIQTHAKLSRINSLSRGGRKMRSC